MTDGQSEVCEWNDPGNTMKESGPSGVFRLVLDELKRAREKFPKFVSDREGFDILDEEHEELKKAIRHGTKREAIHEAIQVAAMAMRLLEDVYFGVESS